MFFIVNRTRRAALPHALGRADQTDKVKKSSTERNSSCALGEKQKTAACGRRRPRCIINE